MDSDETPRVNVDRPPSSNSPIRRRKWMAVAVIGFSLLPFVVLEIGLRVLQPNGIKSEVHAGFGDTSPLFEDNDGDGIYRTSVAKGQFFVSEEFAASVNEENYRRIFVLGGSTVQGRPFSIETSFAEWLEVQLNAESLERDYEVINCGGISYASYRLRPVLREVLSYSPDLIVVATGHNEFLEDRTYADVKSRSGFRLWLEQASSKIHTVMWLRKLLGGAPKVEPTQDANEQPMGEVVETKLDDTAGYASYHRDEDWQQQVAEQYKDSVREMVQMCREAAIPVVLVDLGANLRDCPPFKSELPAELPIDQQQEWQTLFDEATRVQEDDCAAALELYSQLLKIDPQHALVHFRIARCLDQIGRHDEAAESFQKALNYDVCPLRMPESLHEILKEVARETETPLVNAGAAVAASADAADEIPGYDLYLDHVHPTIGAHQVIARSILDTLRQNRMLDVAVEAKLGTEELRALYRNHLRNLPTAYFSNGRRRIGWLEGWAQRQRLFEETVPVDTVGEVSAALRYLQLSDLSTAREHLLIAAAKAEGVLRLLDGAAVLFQQGQTASANWLLSELEDFVGEEFYDSIDLAKLIMACDEKNAVAVRRIYKLHGDDWEQILTVNQTRWSDVMPDVISRAKAFE